jgi:hypothetical protein
MMKLISNYVPQSKLLKDQWKDMKLPPKKKKKRKTPSKKIPKTQRSRQSSAKKSMFTGKYISGKYSSKGHSDEKFMRPSSGKSRHLSAHSRQKSNGVISRDRIKNYRGYGKMSPSTVRSTSFSATQRMSPYRPFSHMRIPSKKELTSS